MRTHPTPVVTTIPTDQVSLAAASPLWVAMAALGAVATVVVAIALLITGSAAHRTIPTLGRALWWRDHVLAPAACAACALMVVSLGGAAHETSALRDAALADSVHEAQTTLAASSSTPAAWFCEVVAHHQEDGTATVSCEPDPANPIADTPGP
ncbi:hypothetical protein [Dietzia sp. 179-F 9C3 NHS]|uniref:hypothetical protein n=1 Tax=Dietzia sp. 179-F 9C3 NHS TaxID=3374295 RepID=UPI00387A1290